MNSPEDKTKEIFTKEDMYAAYLQGRHDSYLENVKSRYYLKHSINDFKRSIDFNLITIFNKENKEVHKVLTIKKYFVEEENIKLSFYEDEELTLDINKSTLINLIKQKDEFIILELLNKTIFCTKHEDKWMIDYFVYNHEKNQILS